MKNAGIIVQRLTTQPTYSLGVWTVVSWTPLCYGGMVPSGLLVFEGLENRKEIEEEPVPEACLAEMRAKRSEDNNDCSCNEQ